MNILNSVLIEGILVKDPELNITTKGTPVCTFTIATNRHFKQDDELQEKVSNFDITVWARLAEVCQEYLYKGRGVRVVGRLKQDQSVEANGQSTVYVVAEHVEFKPASTETQKQVS